MKDIVVKDPVPDISFKTIIKQKMFRNNFCLDTFSMPRTRFMFGDFSSLFFLEVGAGADVYLCAVS